MFTQLLAPYDRLIMLMHRVIMALPSTFMKLLSPAIGAYHVGLYSVLKRKLCQQQ